MLIFKFKSYSSKTIFKLKPALFYLLSSLLPTTLSGLISFLAWRSHFSTNRFTHLKMFTYVKCLLANNYRYI